MKILPPELLGMGGVKITHVMLIFITKESLDLNVRMLYETLR